MCKRHRFPTEQKARKYVFEHIYKGPLVQYGFQCWWPADTRFEVMVGAVLTQHTNWKNVENALHNLVTVNALHPVAIRNMTVSELSCLIYPSGFYNTKALPLKALAEFLHKAYLDDFNKMSDKPTMKLRTELLNIHGVGDETAGCILSIRVRPSNIRR